MQPIVLIASTTWFGMPSRVAMACSDANARVVAIYPKGSPLSKISCIDEAFHYSARRPVQSLLRAILATHPTTIIPCDDRVVEHLHHLHRNAMDLPYDEDIARLIETSLGIPSNYSLIRSRARILYLAQQLNIAVPYTTIIDRKKDLFVWLNAHGFPAVLKIDGTWGGSGVRIIHTWKDANSAYAQLYGLASVGRLLDQVSGHDFFSLLSQITQRRPELTVQKYIEGSTANSLLACRKGQVLDSISVETLLAVNPLGSSTIVRTVSNEAMAHAGATMVAHLGLSGFCGLDFIIDRPSGKPYLIEINPRATQLGHLRLAGRESLVSTLLHSLNSTHKSELSPRTHGQVIAFYPHILSCTPRNPLLATPNLIYDVPWSEPLLTRELMRKSWNRRHLSALTYAAVRRLFTPSGIKVLYTQIRKAIRRSPKTQDAKPPRID